MQIRGRVVKFEWDKWNLNKSYVKHGIEPKQAEEVFLDEEAIVLPDVKHSGGEERFIIVGRILTKLYLFVVFTFRRERVRIISTRRMHKKEVEKYEKIKKNT